MAALPQRLSKRCCGPSSSAAAPTASPHLVGPQKPGPLRSSMPPPDQHVAKQRASVLVWTEVSSLMWFHGRRRGLPTFTRGNPLSDEGMETSMVHLTHHNPHPSPFPTVVGHFVMATAPSASTNHPPQLPSQEIFPCAAQSDTPQSQAIAQGLPTPCHSPSLTFLM